MMAPRNESNSPRRSPSGMAHELVKPPTSHAIRETFESIVIAFVLAFLFRTFEAEAFVIPTGSMAPTLQGAHKDVYCPQCGFNYRASASSENEDEGGETFRRKKEPKAVVACTCPNCGFERDNVSVAPAPVKERTYNGDRILVSKFAYEIADPKRWDVVVFRFPGDAKVNYIKRLVGLPGEELEINHGDLYVKKLDDKNFTIARKESPDKLRAMLQLVDDNHHLAPLLTKAGWPRSWQAPPNVGWREELVDTSVGVRMLGQSSEVAAQQQRFHFDAPAGQPGPPAPQRWLAFGLQRPSPDEWKQLLGRGKIDVPSSPSRVTDFYAYNAVTEFNFDRRETSTHPIHGHWVGDLAVECDVVLHDRRGTLDLDLVEGGFHFQCRFDLANGRAKLAIRGRQSLEPGAPLVDFPFRAADPPAKPVHPAADTPLLDGATAKIMFANCDNELRLWVNDKLVEFDRETVYDSQVIKNFTPEDDDYHPVRMAAADTQLTLDRLRVWRDVYYIRDRDGHTPVRDQTEFVAFKLGPDEFFVMGDNSPASMDARFWFSITTGDIPHSVHRDYLIGKALFIYWPHSLDYFPFCPNFPRMGFVR